MTKFVGISCVHVIFIGYGYNFDSTSKEKIKKGWAAK
jgi:hypothetical protein